MLFTFPSRYWSTIGLSGVFSLAGWSRPIHAEFLVLRATQDPATVRIASGTRLSRPVVALSRAFPSRCVVRHCGPTTPAAPRRRRFGLFPVRSPLLGESLVYFLFLQVLRCFSSLRSPPQNKRIDGLQPPGLSHSEIRGSQVICTFPRLIAAYHVLRRLREPRHPPCALSYFLLASSGIAAGDRCILSAVLLSF